MSAALAEAAALVATAAEQLVGAPVRLVVRSLEPSTLPPAWPGDPPPARHPARNAELRHGRAAARDALVALGHPPSGVASDGDRCPTWPPGVIGSIAHDDDHAVAAVAAPSARFDGLGVDLEPVRPPDPRLLRTVLTDTERRTRPVGLSDALFLTVCFAAKEAVFKAQFPIERCWLEFDDICLDLAASGAASGRLLATLGSEHEHPVFWVSSGDTVITLALHERSGAR